MLVCWSVKYNVAFHCICITDFFLLDLWQFFFPLNSYDTDIKCTIQSMLESILLNQAVDHYVCSDVFCFLKKMVVRYADSNFFLNKFNFKQLGVRTLVTIVGNTSLRMENANSIWFWFHAVVQKSNIDAYYFKFCIIYLPVLEKCVPYMLLLKVDNSGVNK